MGLFSNCLLACDVDGTLIKSGYINPKNIEKIEYFMSEGGIFSLSTGRSIAAVGDVLAQVKRVSPSVMANGCMIYDFENKSVIFKKIVPNESHYITKMILDSGIDVGIEVHCAEKVYTLKRNEFVTLHQTYEKFEAPDTAFEDIDAFEWNKVLCAFKSPDDRERVKALLKNEKADCDFLDTCATINGETNHYYEQIPRGVSKAFALKKLCEIEHIKNGGLFAIGDYYNDVEMLKLSDISAVPCDSPEDIKSLAQHITCKCEDGAVADFIDYLVNLLR